MLNELQASIAECPRCETQLAPPPFTHGEDRLECPLCGAQFVLAEASPRVLPKARLAMAAPPRFAEPAMSHAVAPEPTWQRAEPRNGNVHEPRVTATPTPPTARYESETPLAAPGPVPSFAAEPSPMAPPPGAAPETLAAELPAGSDLPDFDKLASELAPPPAKSALISPPATPPALVESSVETPAAEAPAAAPSPEDDLPSSTAETLADEIEELEQEELAEEQPSGIDSDQLEELDRSPRSHKSHRRRHAQPDPDFDPWTATWTPRRRSSPVKMLAGVVVGGLGGLLLAGYALLWLRGAPADFFRMAEWLPPSLLPKSVQMVQGRDSDDASVDRDAADALQGAETEDETTASDSDAGLAASAPDEAEDDPADDAGALAANDADEAQLDSSVAQATATEPADDATDAAPTPSDDEEPAPLPKNWPSTPVVQDIIEPRFYSLNELTEAVAAAKDAGRTFAEGDLSKPESVRSMGQAYIRLCAVAERMTMIDPAAYGTALFTQQALAKAPMNLVVGASARRTDLAVIAGRWLTHARRQNEGVLLVGRVVDINMQGSWTEYTLEIGQGDQRQDVLVLVEGTKFTTGSDMAVAGLIVADPAQAIDGYEGSASQVIVAGYTFDPAQYDGVDLGTSDSFDLPGF